MSENGRHGRRVLLLTTDRQIDRRILLAADGLRDHGWVPAIVAMPLDAPRHEPALIQRIGGAAAATVTRESLVVHCYRAMRRFVGANRSPMRLLKRLTWRYLVDPERFYDRLFWPSISTMRPDVIVANDLPMLPVAARLAAHSGARLVYDSHELYCEQEFSEPEKRRWRSIEAKYIGRCDAVITVNESIARELERRYAIAHVHVILNAERSASPPAPTRYFHDRFELPESRQVLLFQGGLSTGRNLEVLVRSFAHVRNPDVMLVLLGDGELVGRLRSVVSRRGLGKRVFLHPAIPQRELLAATAAADAGVIPYQANCLNNLYCTPNKLFEFIAAGLPILASDLPELRKFVAESGIGLVGDLSTPEHTAQLVDALFGDGGRLRSMGTNAEHLRREICWESEEKKLIGIFESLR